MSQQLWGTLMFFRKFMKNKKNIQPPFAKTGGSLLVPQDVDIIYGEPAILHKVRKNAKLYEKPPQLREDEYSDSADAFEDDYDKELNRHFIQRKTQKNTTENMVVSHIFSDTETVMARPFEYPDPQNPTKKIKHPFLMQVITFERTPLKSDIPGEEDRTDIGDEVTLKEIGYMYADDVKAKEKFKRKQKHIFPHPPNIEDIIQGGMGDCFLLASIIALLVRDELQGTSTGSEFIMNMMRQQNDGSVIVKLYHPLTFEPVYVRVENSEHEKSYLKGLVTDNIEHKASWVHILEKAYAGIGFLNYNAYRKANKNYQAVVSDGTDEVAISPASFLALYGEGGRPEFAMRILTGNKTTNEDLVQEQANKQILQKYPFPYNELLLAQLRGKIASPIEKVLRNKKEYDPRNNPSFQIKKKDFKMMMEECKQAYQNHDLKVLKGPYSWSALENSTIYKVFAGNESAFVDLVIYANLLNLYYPDEYQKLIELWQVKKTNDYIHCSTQDLLKIIKDMEKLSPPVPDSVLQGFKHYITTSKTVDKKTNREIYFFNGQPGSGQYSQRQYELFDELSQFSKKGYLLTAGTYTDFGDNNPKGLFSSHEYTITKVHTVMHNGKALLMVRLRNPWGMLGRTYKFKKDSVGTAKATDDPEFDLDITDFERYFYNYSKGEIPVSNNPVINNSDNNVIYLPQVAITGFPFKTLKEEQQKEFVLVLIAEDISQTKALLANQGIQDLFELSRYLQQSLIDQKNSLKVNPVLAKDIKRNIKLERRLLRQVRSQFNQRITKNKETYKQIADNSKKYLKQQNEKQNFFSRYFNIFKSKLDMVFTKGKFTNRYLNIYDNHSQYQKGFRVLSKDFNTISDGQKIMFLKLLMNKPDPQQDIILQSQSLQSIKDIHRFLDEKSKDAHTLFGSNSVNKSGFQQANLINKINEILTNTIANIEKRYDAKKYGVTTDPIKDLMHTYLLEHRDMLIHIMDFSGVPKAHLHDEHLHVSVLPNFGHQYDVRVSLPTGDMSQPITVLKEEVLNFAWLQLSGDEKNKLRKILSSAPDAWIPENTMLQRDVES